MFWSASNILLAVILTIALALGLWVVVDTLRISDLKAQLASEQADIAALMGANQDFKAEVGRQNAAIALLKDTAARKAKEAADAIAAAGKAQEAQITFLNSAKPGADGDCVAAMDLMNGYLRAHR